MTTVAKPYRRSYVVSQDVGTYRHSLTLGAATFAGTYGSLSTTGPMSIAIAVGAGVFIATYIYRLFEADRRAIEYEDKPMAGGPIVRPMATVGSNPLGNHVRVGKFTLRSDQWQAIGREAAKRDGAITRETLKAAGLPREYYQRVSEFQDDMKVLQYAEGVGRSVRLVPRGVEFMANPVAPTPPRTKSVQSARIERSEPN